VFNKTSQVQQQTKQPVGKLAAWSRTENQFVGGGAKPPQRNVVVQNNMVVHFLDARENH
jgi:hypothetical protein